MKISDVANRPGIIIETLTSAGIPTGNVYRLFGTIQTEDGIRIIGWMQSGLQREFFLHPSVACRIILDN